MDPKPGREQLAAALAAIDGVNGLDPVQIRLGGRCGPRALLQGLRAHAWVLRLDPAAGACLQLAARAHHLRRWEVPRTSEPPGRAGYLRWRAGLGRRQARDAEALLEGLGVEAGERARVGALMRKEGLGSDPETQTFEDALCLVFLESELESFAAGREPATLRRVLERTLRKMSPRARAEAARLAPGGPAAGLLDTILGRPGGAGS